MAFLQVSRTDLTNVAMIRKLPGCGLVLPAISIFLCVTLPAFAQERTGFDGPAELPRGNVKSSIADTPAPEHEWRARDSSAFQQALDKAKCGDTIELQPGSTYSGSFDLPAKLCDDTHWIVIRTNTPAATLPPEGTRITPCYAGVPALPGRPALNCSSTQNVMARIAGVKGQNRIISNSPGANRYRFQGLEIADTGANGDAGGFYDLVILKQADHIVFDRCWIHGSPTGEDVKGVEFEKSSNIAIVDSFISDIHSKTSAYGADSSAVGSVTGFGPVKIVNNFLEA